MNKSYLSAVFAFTGFAADAFASSPTRELIPAPQPIYQPQNNNSKNFWLAIGAGVVITSSMNIATTRRQNRQIKELGLKI